MRACTPAPRSPISETSAVRPGARMGARREQPSAARHRAQLGAGGRAFLPCTAHGARAAATATACCAGQRDRRSCVTAFAGSARRSMSMPCTRGAQALLGEHDFTSFRAVECQSTTALRHVDAISVKGDGPLVVIEISANAYLHHMVRNIAGTLLMVGAGEASARLGRRDPGGPRPHARRYHGTRKRALPVVGALPEVAAGPGSRRQSPVGYDRGPGGE